MTMLLGTCRIQRRIFISIRETLRNLVNERMRVRDFVCV